ncbi:hypothetical protein BMI86_10185 [Thioclava sp. DLFJ5-1]|uniref:hypothetical protein n=1 Tax=Thioclava sp. DLFJ5-1 TaxID=1915314 RepID=UPI00099612F7|nr:hypothetical protein [Thioclava sp. DLFJ5-1]OOY20866.1 hypothetical protein BMI86_10185 [Thioclava sp. DLFJ5-1]
MKYELEADLCRDFLTTVPADWTAYPEACNFDIVLAHKHGARIGIEAKLRLNAKVINQALEGIDWKSGPDFRAVLVPFASDDMVQLCQSLHLTVIRLYRSEGGTHNPANNWAPGKQFARGRLYSTPGLPEFPEAFDLSRVWLYRDRWHDFSPVEALELPDFVPDVQAGSSAPRKLSRWKIQALRLVCLMEARGQLRRSDFLAAGVSMSMWSQSHWIESTSTRGIWAKGRNWPAERWKAEHPEAFPQIEADFPKWAAEHAIGLEAEPTQGVML